MHGYPAYISLPQTAACSLARKRREASLFRLYDVFINMPPKKLSKLVSKMQLIPLLEIEANVFLFLPTRKMSRLIFK